MDPVTVTGDLLDTKSTVQFLIELVNSHTPYSASQHATTWDDDDDYTYTSRVFGAYEYRCNCAFDLLTGLTTQSSYGPRPLVSEYNPRYDKHFQGVFDATWNETDDSLYIRDNDTLSKVMQLIDQSASSDDAKSHCKAIIHTSITTPIEATIEARLGPTFDTIKPALIEALSEFTFVNIQKVSKISQLNITVWVDPNVIDKKLNPLLTALEERAQILNNAQ